MELEKQCEELRTRNRLKIERKIDIETVQFKLEKFFVLLTWDSMNIAMVEP